MTYPVSLPCRKSNSFSQARDTSISSPWRILRHAFVTPTPLLRPTLKPGRHLTALAPTPPFLAPLPRTAKLRAALQPDLQTIVLPPAQEPSKTLCAPQSTLGRGMTFSRRRIGLYELHREGVDPSVLLKRTLRFEATYVAVITAFVGVLFVMPVTTGVQIPEGPLATMVALLMGAYATDTFAFNAAVTRALAAACSDRLRVTRHEAAHLLVSHLLGFCVDGYALPLPMATFRAARGDAPPPGVRLGLSLAQGDARLIAAAGLSGMAAELLFYGSVYGAEQDMAEVSRRVRASFDEADAIAQVTVDATVVDTEVVHIVRWGLLVATRLVKQHAQAFDALVDAMLANDSIERCLALIDRLADPDVLAEQPFGSL